MKRRMKFLVGLDTALAPIVAVLTGAISSNFPSVSGPVLWSVLGAIFVFVVIINIIVAISKDDKKEAPSISSYSLAPQSAVQSSTFSPPARSSSTQKGTLQDATKLPSRVPSALISTQIRQASATQPSTEHPMLICLAIDVSYSMKKPIFDHTGKVIERWASFKEALEHFVHLGVAWFKDPETQRV